jgi:ketosteroid isomerase-like protein
MNRYFFPVLCWLALASLPLLGQTAPPVRPRPGASRSLPPVAPAASVVPAHDSLYQQIARLDAQAFAAYNAHDADKLMSFFAPDLEFYHDTGGLAGFSQTRQGFASVFAQNADIRRDLVPGSLEVYPIKGYGAIQIGAHRFCHHENGKEDCGTFKFVMVWQHQPSGWKITRVVSYGH